MAANYANLHSQRMPHRHKSAQIIGKVGSKTILKNNFFCRDGFQFFFYQGQKLKLAIFVGTKSIF